MAASHRLSTLHLVVALAAPAVAFQAPRCAAPQLVRQHLFGNKNKPGDDGKYESLAVDVAAYEALEEPLVAVGESDGRGRGVFAVNDIAAGTTITEYVGMLAATPETRTDDLALYQNYYGKDWRLYSQRYEIGLTGTRVADAGGLARGGAVAPGTEAAVLTCDVDEDLTSCVTRAGEGQFILLGKVKDVDPKGGVAQLINDHSAVRAVSKAPETAGDGKLRASDVDGLILKDPAWPYEPVAVDGAALRVAVGDYIDAIVPGTNAALVQARTGLGTGIAAPRVFAVATRDVKAGDELFLTYGAEWWLAQLRRAALAQLVSCDPPPERAAALEQMIRAIEYVSCEAVAPQVAAVREAGCMPSAFVTPLEALAPLDDLLGEGWKEAILREEFSLATECSVEDLYATTFK